MSLDENFNGGWVGRSSDVTPAEKTSGAGNAVRNSEEGSSGKRESIGPGSSNDKYGRKVIGNRYRLGDELGRGASGKVYRGLDTQTGQHVAVKQVSLERLKPVDISSIMTEVELLKSLNHENVVRYLGSFQTRHHLYIVMELVEAGSLSSIIKNAHFGPFPESLVAVYIDQVLRGLVYLHAQGVVHRDVKGANILTTREGLVKLADFGVAARMGEDNMGPSRSKSEYDHGDHEQPAGTPYWMAPEVIELKTVTTASDIWSVGCLAIELLTGQPPYFDLQPLSAMYNIVQEPHPPLPPSASDLMRGFLLSCFSKDPSARPSAEVLTGHKWIVSNRKTLKDAWGKTIKPSIKAKEENNDEHHSSVALVVERLIASDLAPSVSELSLADQSSDSFQTAVEANEHPSQVLDQVENTNIKIDLVDQSILEQEDELDISGEKVVHRLHDSHNETNKGVLCKGLIENSKIYSLQDEADVIRQIRSLKVTAAPGERSIVEEAATAASARTISGYILKQKELAKAFTAADGLCNLREIFDSPSERVLIPCLDVLLVVVKSDLRSLEESCSLGLIPAVLRFCSKQHAFILRQKAAEYGHLLALGSGYSSRLLIACQGIPFLLSLMNDDPRHVEEFALCNAAMASFWTLLRRSSLPGATIRANQILRLLSHHGMAQKIVRVLPSVLKRASELGTLYRNLDSAKGKTWEELKTASMSSSASQNNAESNSISSEANSLEDEGFLVTHEHREVIHLTESLVNMFAALAQGDGLVKAKCSRKDTINSMFGLTVRMPTDLQKIVLRGVRTLCGEETVLHELEAGNIIAYAAAQLPRDDAPELQSHALSILRHLCQLSWQRQEKALEAGAVPWLCRLAIRPVIVDDSIPGTRENDAVSLLCSMTHSTPKMRTSLWKNGAIDVLLQTLKDESHQVSAMEAIAAWLDAELSRVEPKLLEEAAITRMVLLMPSGSGATRQQMDKLPSIIAPMSKIVAMSSKIGLALSAAGLVSRAVDLMAELHPSATLSLMDLIKVLYEISPHPKEFLSKNRVIPALKMIVASNAGEQGGTLIQIQAKNLLKTFSVNAII